jgi:hypothetical protein
MTGCDIVSVYHEDGSFFTTVILSLSEEDTAESIINKVYSDTSIDMPYEKRFARLHILMNDEGMREYSLRHEKDLSEVGAPVLDPSNPLSAIIARRNAVEPDDEEEFESTPDVPGSNETPEERALRRDAEDLIIKANQEAVKEVLSKQSAGKLTALENLIPYEKPTPTGRRIPISPEVSALFQRRIANEVQNQLQPVSRPSSISPLVQTLLAADYGIRNTVEVPEDFVLNSAISALLIPEGLRTSDLPIYIQPLPPSPTLEEIREDTLPLLPTSFLPLLSDEQLAELNRQFDNPGYGQTLPPPPIIDASDEAKNEFALATIYNGLGILLDSQHRSSYELEQSDYSKYIHDALLKMMIDLQYSRKLPSAGDISTVGALCSEHDKHMRRRNENWQKLKRQWAFLGLSADQLSPAGKPEEEEIAVVYGSVGPLTTESLASVGAPYETKEDEEESEENDESSEEDFLGRKYDHPLSGLVNYLIAYGGDDVREKIYADLFTKDSKLILPDDVLWIEIFKPIVEQRFGTDSIQTYTTKIMTKTAVGFLPHTNDFIGGDIKRPIAVYVPRMKLEVGYYKVTYDKFTRSEVRLIFTDFINYIQTQTLKYTDPYIVQRTQFRSLTK